MKTLKQKMKGIGPARRKKVEARAATLIAEEMTLQELQQARKVTQVRIAKALGISQDGFLSAFGIISSHFRVGRHLCKAGIYRALMKSRFVAW